MKVTCKLANASENINGIEFVRQEDGSVVATAVSAEDAAMFSGIEGYVTEDEKEPAPSAPGEPVVVQEAAEPVVDQPAVDTPAVAAEDVAPADGAVVAAQVQVEAKPAKRK